MLIFPTPQRDEMEVKQGWEHKNYKVVVVWWWKEKIVKLERM